MAKHKNILPSTYVPVYSRNVLAAVLSRLAKPSLLALIRLWSQTASTQPVQPTSKPHVSQQEYRNHVRGVVNTMKEKKWTKARIVDAILVDFWPNGLNLLQLAQVDCQFMVDSPGSSHWVSSTVKDAWGAEVPLSLDPAPFLERLATELGNLFMSYIYVCTHPTFPLVLIRIQVFDLAPHRGRTSNYTSKMGSRSTQPHISSNRPYFLAVPMNSPYLIHSPGDDLVAQSVLSVVQTSLPSVPSRVLKLETPESQKPVRSLKSMFLLKGSSRFANSLGAWLPYADGEADISPLAKLDAHRSVLSVSSGQDTCLTRHEQVEKMANVRFKGSPSGEVVSETLFDQPKSIKKRKVSSNHQRVSDPAVPSFSRRKNQYASLVPIRYAEFDIQEPLREVPGSEEKIHSSVKLKLIGTDVFAGLHELSVIDNDPQTSVIDLTKLPGWLTGEEGQSCGVVKQGKFFPT